MTQNGDLVITRQRLLEAAGEEFAEQGFRQATIRAICKRAGANVAAVNYHFGGKDQLYADAIRYAHTCATGQDIARVASASKDQTPDKRLHAFIRAFFAGILEEGKPAWHAKLMAREIAEPTAVLDEIAQNGVKPRLEILSEILRDILGPAAPRQMIHNCARSIVGQILFYHFARPMLDRVFPDERIDATRIDDLSDHIARFSLEGLRGMLLKQSSERRRARGVSP